GEVDETHVEAGRALAHALQEPERATVDVVGRNDMGAAVEQLEDRADCCETRSEGKAGRTAFQVGHGAFEGEARRVLAAGIFEALVNAGALLAVGRRRVDRYHDSARGWIVALAAMDGAGREGEAVPRGGAHRVRLRWLIRSTRVIKPMNSSPS